MKVRKAVIPAAGLGTRFLPATKAMPKEMLPIVDKPTIQYIVEEAVASGIEEILIITGRGKGAIEDHFDKAVELEMELVRKNEETLLQLVQAIASLVDIHYIRQKEAKGLGHAIHCAAAFVGREPFAVLLGDDVVYNEGTPCLQQMMAVYAQYGASVLGVQTVSPADVSKYGIVAGRQAGERVYRVRGLVEKPAVGEAPSNMAILGRYIITPQIFPILAATPPGRGGEIQLTDALQVLAEREAVYAYDFIGRRYDVGDKLGYLAATVETALRREDLRDEFRRYLWAIATAEQDGEKKSRPVPIA